MPVNLTRQLQTIAAGSMSAECLSKTWPALLELLL